MPKVFDFNPKLRWRFRERTGSAERNVRPGFEQAAQIPLNGASSRLPPAMGRTARGHAWPSAAALQCTFNDMRLADAWSTGQDAGFREITEILRPFALLTSRGAWRESATNADGGINADWGSGALAVWLGLLELTSCSQPFALSVCRGSATHWPVGRASRQLTGYWREAWRVANPCRCGISCSKPFLPANCGRDMTTPTDECVAKPLAGPRPNLGSER